MKIETNDCKVTAHYKYIVGAKGYDTLRINLVNASDSNLSCVLDIQEKIQGKWYFSDLYTDFFNEGLSKQQFKEISKTKGVKILHENYTVPHITIQSNSKTTKDYIIQNTGGNISLLRFKIRVIDFDNCNYYSKSYKFSF